MLQRFSQVGEFYVLSKPGIPPKVGQMGFMGTLSCPSFEHTHTYTPDPTKHGTSNQRGPDGKDSQY